MSKNGIPTAYIGCQRQKKKCELGYMEQSPDIAWNQKEKYGSIHSNKNPNIIP